MNIRNNLISDINNFFPVTYFKSNQNGFKTQKNHKSNAVFFKQNDKRNIDNDAINNNNDNIFQNLYGQSNNNIIMGNNGQKANGNNMEENNEVDNRNRVNVIHIKLRQGNNAGD